MILFGKYTTGDVTHFFIRNETNKEITLMVFRTRGILNDIPVNLEPEDFKKKKNTDFYGAFLNGGLKVSITETKIYGNVNIANRLSNLYSKSLNKTYKTTNTEEFVDHITTTKSNTDLDYVIYSEYTFNDAQTAFKKREIFKIEVQFKDEKLIAGVADNETALKSIFNSLNRTIQWEDYDLFNTEAKDNTNLILATKAKTLQQLRVSHDLSWYFDDNGKSKKHYEIINSIDRLQEVIKSQISKVELWSVDVETTGLKCFSGKNRKHLDSVVSLMMSWEEDQAIFIPIDMMYIKNIEPEWAIILKPYLEKIPAVGHNISFDGRALFSEFGIDVNIAYDTQQLNFNINCHDAKFHNSLKYLEHRFFKVDTLELSDIFGTRKLAGLFRYLPQQLALIYACPDVDLCLQLFYLLWDKLPTSCRKTFKLDMDTMKNITKMDCIGNRVDLQYALEFRKANNQDMNTLKELIFKVVGQTLLSNDFINELAKTTAKENLDSEETRKKVEDFYNSPEYKNAKFSFNVDSNQVLGNVLFNMLKYPVKGVSKKTGDPLVNASVFKSLLSYKLPNDTDGYLKKDIPSAVSNIERLKNENVPPLVSMKEYNRLKYPLAHLIVEYRLRYKRNSTFFKQLLDESIDGYYYTSSKMANAETFRIINVVQVLQGFMKQMVIPYSDDHYMLVFDFSQIEYRYMAGMANVEDLIKNLNSPRADFHRECCALLHNIKPWLVTSKMRKEGKSLNFAIPYGMGTKSVAEQLYGVANEETKAEANIQLNQWQKSFHKIWDLLEEKRDLAIKNGYAESLLGRRRYFYGEEGFESWRKNLNGRSIASIRRAAGNFPIQSGAADLFKIALNRFRARLKKEGLDELVLTTATIHDELVNSVHKSVNPYYLYKIIYEECMLSIKGHPRYYAGISICDNWYEGKDDLYEAPIEFVEYMINERQDISSQKFMTLENPKLQVTNDIISFMNKLFLRDFSKVGFDITNPEQDTTILLNGLEDYFLREKISVYHKPLPGRKVFGSKVYEDDKFLAALETFIATNGTLDEYTIIYPDNYPGTKKAKITKDSYTPILEDDTTSLQVSQTEATSNLETTSLFSEDNSSNEVADISDINLDLDDELFNVEESGDISSVDALILLEENEGELFGDTAAYYYLDNESLSDDEKANQLDIIDHPDKYIQIYDSFSNKVRVSADKLILDYTGVPRGVRNSINEYLDSCKTSKEDIGSVSIVIKIGPNLDNTHSYVKGYDLKTIQSLIENV